MFCQSVLILLSFGELVLFLCFLDIVVWRVCCVVCEFRVSGRVRKCVNLV